MSLQENILADLTASMKAKDAEKLGVLRMLKAAFLNESKAASGSDTLDDKTVVVILKREAKKRKEAATAYTEGNRPELAEKENAELAIIETYLPEQMSDEDVSAIVDEVIANMESPQFGAVMGAVMKKTAGQVDGDQVKKLVEEKLNT